MKRLLTTVAAVGALMALTVAPAGAQEDLGFETDITEGAPGEIVAGQVDTDDVTEHCETEIGEDFEQGFRARIFAFFEVLQELLPGFDVGAESNQDAVLFFYIAIALGALIDDEIAEDVLAQTFVMTFADIATQEPIGEMGNFDPETGEGTVVVPDIDPGLWAVAAACVAPVPDADTILAAASAHADFIAGELGLPPDPWPAEFDFSQFLIDEFGSAFDPEFMEFVAAIGPTILASVVEADALGAVIFCILDEDGECPDDDEIDDVEPPAAVAVVAEPVFTG